MPLLSPDLPLQAVTAPRTSLAVAYQGAPGAYSEGAAAQAGAGLPATARASHSRPTCEAVAGMPCRVATVYGICLAGEASCCKRRRWQVWYTCRLLKHCSLRMPGQRASQGCRFWLDTVGEVMVAVRHCLLAAAGRGRGGRAARGEPLPGARAVRRPHIRRLPGAMREAFHDIAGASKGIADRLQASVTPSSTAAFPLLAGYFVVRGKDLRLHPSHTC